jgi:hypothetical protein
VKAGGRSPSSRNEKEKRLSICNFKKDDATSVCTLLCPLASVATSTVLLVLPKKGPVVQ